MISVKEAYDIVKKNEPLMNICGCSDYGKFYAFGLRPWGVTESDGWANSCVYTVNKKTGKYKIMHLTELPFIWPKEIDISKINKK